MRVYASGEGGGDSWVGCSALASGGGERKVNSLLTVNYFEGVAAHLSALVSTPLTERERRNIFSVVSFSGRSLLPPRVTFDL